MGFALLPGAILGVASGLALALLGGVIMRFHPRRASSVAFSLFALLWGAAVVTANVARMATSGADALFWIRLSVLCYIPLYLPLVVFASSLPTPRGAFTSPARRLLAAIPAFTLLGLAIFAPSLFVQRANPAGAGFVPVYGPLANAVTVVALQLALVTITFAALRKLSSTADPVHRGQLALLIAGLLFYASYRAGNIGATLSLLPGLVSLGSLADVGLLVACALAGALVALLAASMAWRDRQLPWRGVVIMAALLPLFVGVAETWLRIRGLAGYDTVGLWRLATVAVFAYAIARHRLFDLDLRVKKGLRAGTIGAAFVSVFFVVSETAANVFQARTGSPMIGIAAAGLLVFFLAPLQRMGDRLANAAMPGVHEAPDYLRYRKFEVYKAALESALRDGQVDASERAILADLRESLGIGAADADALERDLARGAAP